MTLHDDPRLTRYALGEMNDADRAAFEATMTEDDRAEVEAIRALGGTLTGALGGTGIPACVPAQPGTAQPGTARRQQSRRTHWMLAAAAAVTIAGIGFTAGVLSTRHESPSFALRPIGPPAMLNRNDNRPSTQPQIISPLNKTYAPVDASKQLAATPGDAAQVRFADAAIQPSPAEAKRRVLANKLAETSATMEKVAQAQKWVSAPVDAALTLDAMPSASLTPQARMPVLKATDARQFDANDSFLLPDEDRSVDRRLMTRGDRADKSAESYAHLPENPFVDPRATPLSTFGVDVDTASYANVRRFLTTGQRPPADAARVEELINYFPTTDAPPADGKPFAVHAEVARCPWNASHDLVRVALKAKEVAVDKRPTSNLVFLIDVSGSMNEPDKLPLVKRGLGQLVDQLGENDRVAIVVYAGNSGLVLPSTNAADKATIRAAIDRLEAGGSTNGGQGIELAYATAAANFVRGGANRVILCTDGDFNVGVTDRGSLLELIQQKAKAGTFLNVLGFGTGNVKDDTMEMLADKGNGQYAYVDTDREAHKVFVEQASGTLVTVAKDVKIQVEFNPAAVASYRLIGYENRALAKEDFNNDLKDAGEIGAGHNVVALYEIERRARFSGPATTDKLKYQPEPTTPAPDANAELLTLKLRYKAPDAPLEQGVSQLIEQPLAANDRAIEQASADFQFDAAVAGFGMLLRGSSAKGECDWPMVARLARAGLGADAGGYRAEFLSLVDKASTLAR